MRLRTEGNSLPFTGEAPAGKCITKGQIMGRMQQEKGKRGELELAEILTGYGYKVRRGDSMNYGTQPDISGLPGVHCEVKRQEKLNLSAALEQARRDSQKFRDGLPAVFHRRNREEWQVTMNLKDWMQIYQEGRNNE